MKGDFMKKFLFLLFLPVSVFAQSAALFETIYGPMSTGCIQTSVTTTGNNRSVQLTNGKRYLLYGVDTTAGMNGATIRCIQGGSAVDVNAIAGSRVGFVVYANQQVVIQVRSSNDAFVSCISQVATQKYELCVLP
jgi:hypothetical protein